MRRFIVVRLSSSDTWSNEGGLNTTLVQANTHRQALEVRLSWLRSSTPDAADYIVIDTAPGANLAARRFSVSAPVERVITDTTGASA